MPYRWAKRWARSRSRAAIAATVTSGTAAAGRTSACGAMPAAPRIPMRNGFMARMYRHPDLIWRGSVPPCHCGPVTSDDVVRWEPSERWIRGVKGELTVVDSRRAILFWEAGRKVPLYAFPEADIRLDALRPAAEPAVGSHPGATEFYDLDVAGAVTPNVAWRLPLPELPGHL